MFGQVFEDRVADGCVGHGHGDRASSATRAPLVAVAFSAWRQSLAEVGPAAAPIRRERKLPVRSARRCRSARHSAAMSMCGVAAGQKAPGWIESRSGRKVRADQAVFLQQAAELAAIFAGRTRRVRHVSLVRDHQAGEIRSFERDDGLAFFRAVRRERKRAGAELRLAKEAAERANRAKSEFLATM